MSSFARFWGGVLIHRCGTILSIVCALFPARIRPIWSVSSNFTFALILSHIYIPSLCYAHSLPILMICQPPPPPVQNDQDPFEPYLAHPFGPFGPLKDMFRSLDAVAQEACAPALSYFIEMVLPLIAAEGGDAMFDTSEDMDKTEKGDGKCEILFVPTASFLHGHVLSEPESRLLPLM